MARIYEVLELCYPNGVGMERYRYTVRSDEESWPPRGLCEHEHRTRGAARRCRDARRRLRRVFGRMAYPKRGESSTEAPLRSVLAAAAPPSSTCSALCGCGMPCTKEEAHTIHGCALHYPE